jgi:hypothetical protein
VTGLGNGVDLDGERNGNTHLPQLAGERDGLGRSPAVAVEDDGGALFLDGGDDAIVVGIEEAHDPIESLLSMVVAEDLRVDEGVPVAEVCGKLHLGVPGVIATDKASDKPNDDHVPVGGGGRYRGRGFAERHCLAMGGGGRHEDYHGEDENKRGELPGPRVSDACSPSSLSACHAKRRRAIALGMYPQEQRIGF